MAATPYSVAPAPPITPVSSADHTAAPLASPSPVAPQPLASAAPPAAQDTVTLASTPIAKSLDMSDRILAQIDQEAARVTSGAQPASDPRTATAGPGQEAKLKGPLPAPYRSANKQGHDNPDPQKQAATSGLIPMQVMQGKTKALAQSGETAEEIALALHLDLKTVEEYLGSSSGGSSSGSAAARPVDG